MRATINCPICTKVLSLREELTLGSEKLFMYKCGHAFGQPIHAPNTSNLNLSSIDGSKRARPYQEEGVKFIIESGYNCIIGDQMRLGKSLENGAFVYTPTGSITIGEIEPETVICLPNGQTSEVESVHPQGLRDVYKITFSDNTTIECDDEHLWQVTTPDRKFRGAYDLVLPLREIRQRYKQANGNLKYYIPVTKPVFFKTQETPIDAYVLGVLLGDGYLGEHRSAVSFSSEDLELVKELSKLYRVQYKDNFDYRIHDEKLWDSIKELKLHGCISNSKFIPQIYKINSIDVRTAILQGLMDTDGYVSEQGTVQFTSVSEQLLNDVKFICESLGCTARVTSKIPTYTYKGEKLNGQLAYTLTINCPLELVPFRLYRKIERLSSKRKFFPARGFKNIEYVGQKECTCIRIKDEYGLFLTDNFIVTHNTPQSLLALKNALKERTPCLIVVKSANLWQWTREYSTWVSGKPFDIYPIVGSKAWIPPGFPAYIISMDTFSTQSACKCGHRYHEGVCKAKKGQCPCRIYESNGEGVLDNLKKIDFKLIIADEAHSFKNTQSNRSQALVDFVTFMNTGEEIRDLQFSCSRCGNEWISVGKRTYDKRIGHSVIAKSSSCPKCGQYCYIQQQHKDGEDPIFKDKRIQKLLTLGNDESTTAAERELALAKAAELGATQKDLGKDKPCGLILLTGTPILNMAEEYFVPLNLVAPDKITSLSAFRANWLESNSKNQFTHVKSYKIAAFKEFIKPYVLRREKEDVYKDLPELNRIFTVIEPEKDTLSVQYNKILDKMEEKLALKANPSYWDMADDLMALRRICGMMKVMWTADYIETCLLDSDNQRYAVGIHHHSVRDVLALKLGNDQNCLLLSGEDSSDQKDYIMRRFADSKQRVLIINMLAGGVGMDFHYCNNVTILERQWNSAMEEQFEFRFYNPDKSIKKDPTNVEYIIAKGTIDEWFFDMVEGKRKIFGETISNNWSIDQDTVSFRSLVEQAVGNRL